MQLLVSTTARLMPEKSRMKIQIGNHTFTVTLEKNTSVEALLEMLPLKIDMHDYGNMEKVGPIGASLPKNDKQMTTEPGDLILWCSIMHRIHGALPKSENWMM
jgi:hypothetical protein